MKIDFSVKRFNEIDLDELYAIMQLRNAVFVVEQNCPYQDLDNKDQPSYHLICSVDGRLGGYSRLIPASVSYEEVSIGRICVLPEFRGIQLGKKLVEQSILHCDKLFGKVDIRIGAQLYLLKFYNALGFVEIGDSYDEDGIPHIQMIRRSIKDS